MSERRKVVSVIGNRAVEEGSLRYNLAFLVTGQFQIRVQIGRASCRERV